jgi:hypothetical protein
MPVFKYEFCVEVKLLQYEAILHEIVTILHYIYQVIINEVLGRWEKL